MGPSAIPSELYAVAAGELVRLWDPITFEGTLSLDVPLQFQGGGNCMIPKPTQKPSRYLKNMRGTGRRSGTETFGIDLEEEVGSEPEGICNGFAAGRRLWLRV